MPGPFPSVIPGSRTHFDAKISAHRREGGDQKRIGRHEERLNRTRFHFILHPTAPQRKAAMGGTFLAGPEQTEAVWDTTSPSSVCSPGSHEPIRELAGSDSVHLHHNSRVSLWYRPQLRESFPDPRSATTRCGHAGPFLAFICLFASSGNIIFSMSERRYQPFELTIALSAAPLAQVWLKSSNRQ